MNAKLNLSVAIYAYFLIVGISYLWGFWLPFDLNILAFADLADIIKSSVYPMLPAAGFLIFQSALDGFNTTSQKKYEDYVAAGGFYRLYMRFLMVINYSVLGALAAYICYVVVTEQGYQKLKGIYPLLSALAFYFFINRGAYLLRIDVRIRVFVLLVLCMMPTVAFRTGNDIANKIKNLEGNYWILKTSEPCKGVDELIFLARLGSKYLAMSKSDKSVCILQDTTIQLVKANTTNPVAVALPSVIIKP